MVFLMIMAILENRQESDDKDAIEAIYGDSFLDITNLSKLPKILVSLIKKRIQKSIR